MLSRSGATVFAVLRSKEAAVTLGERVAQEFGPDLWLCACETVG